MRRLSVIDVEGGSQPIFNEDRTVCVTLNGEIYNFRELRLALERSGHVFRTRSDTEVLVHAYEEFGLGFLNKLNGMFALALHDANRGQLILARDQMGIKPLFYALTPDALVWGSEVKAVLASGLVGRTLEPSSLLEYLSWEYVPGRGTLFSEVCKLEAGRYLVARRDGRVEGPVRYWDIPTDPPDVSATEDEWLERLDDAVGKAVRRQLVSDVPLGAFLSGGVDSSLVVAEMGLAKTFSIGFDDPSYNELPFSNEVARHLGTDHRTEVIKPNVAELFDSLMYFMDDPIGDFSIFPTYLVSKLARESVTVCLSGDGGDELFGGYETYLAEMLGQRYSRLPQLARATVSAAAARLPATKEKKGLINKTKRFLEGYDNAEALGHTRWRKFLSGALTQSLFSEEFRRSIERPADTHILALFSESGRLGPITRCQYVDAKSYLPDNCLVKVDRMSMAVSLEVRVPLLDRTVVELAFSMPDELKVRRNKTKVLLKKLAARSIPRRCVYRPKEGFSIPIKNWLGEQFRPVLEEMTSATFLRSQGVFAEPVVSQLKREHLAGVANHSHILWSIVIFNAWCKRWLSRNGDAIGA